MAMIESEHGPLLDVAAVLGDPSKVTLAVTSGCMAAWLAAGGAPERITAAHVTECAVAGRMASFALEAQHLLWSYFDTGKPKEAEAADQVAGKPVERSFPWRDYVGPAMGIWGMSTDEAWAMTMPEWWAACDAYLSAHGGKAHDGPTPLLTREKAKELAALNRIDIRAELQEKWRNERG